MSDFKRLEHLVERARQLDEEALAVEREIRLLAVPYAKTDLDTAERILDLLPSCVMHTRIQVREIIAEYQEENRT